MSREATETSTAEDRRESPRHAEDTPDERCWHALEAREAAEALLTDVERGLSEDEVAARLETWGPNRLPSAKGRSLLEITLDQFKSLIVALLVAATIIAFALGEQLEGFAVLVVVVINALIGVVTELSAARALSALQRQMVSESLVIRDGREQSIESSTLVPGDIVVLQAGGRVPADGRIVEAAALQVDEAPLTGESLPVRKDASRLDDPETPLAERLDMAFMETSVSDGRARLLVTATGSRTEIGRIGTLVEEAEKDASPLERRLAQLGRSLVFVVLGLCAIIVVAGFLQGHGFLYMLEVGISLSIAAVPEGLPAVATMTLAIGMLRMARRRALIRRLPAVETLGSTTVICTDKTGTLTRSEMLVTRLVFGRREIEVSGRGYEPTGEFSEHGEPIDPRADEVLARGLRVAAMCNDAELEEQDGQATVLGDPTEGALLVAARKGGVDRREIEREERRVDELPFDSESKRMVTVHCKPGGGCVAYVKGSPGAVLERSRFELTSEGIVELTDERRRELLEENARLARAALRVLGLAYRELPKGRDGDPAAELVFVGLAGMSDPLREEAKEAIDTCRDAGIRVIMITGDQLETATAIAHRLGIDRDGDGGELQILHARDLKELEPDEWLDVTERAAAFARVTPEHKLRIVEALQRKGNVVAMTGDGVNDAPALKKADIGVAMGIKGTEVAKETADMVITDDNFATIVHAVEQGRIIYANIVKFIHYLFSCNFAEILTVFVAIIIGWPSPLAPLQILWLNIITDVFPAMALALEPSAPNMMKRPPRDPREAVLRPRFVGLIAWQGAMLAALSLGAFAWSLSRSEGSSDEAVAEARTVAFLTLALGQVFHAFNTRSRRESIFNRRLFSNGWLWAAVIFCIGLQTAAVTVPLLQRVLRTTTPDAASILAVAICSVATLLIVELVKLFDRRTTGPARESE